MFLTFITVFYVLFGSSCGFQRKEGCYGRSVDIDIYSYPFYKGPLYFYPNSGGARKLLMDNRQAMDERLKVHYSTVKLTQLTEADNGNFVITGSNGQNLNLFSLTVLDCSTKKPLFYGDELVYTVPRQADLLEFTPSHSLDQPQLLWDHADPLKDYGRRGKVSKNIFRISRVTQEDNGFYNFKQKDQDVVLRLELTVQEKASNHNTKVSSDIFLAFPWENGDWTVTYRPHNGEEEVTIVEAGRAVWKNNPLYVRMKVEKSGIDISNVEISDAGIFNFRDPAGNLALVSQVDIYESGHTKTYVIVAVVVAVGLLLCCCWCCCKACCCDDEKAQTELPTTYNHDLNEPAGPGSTAPPYSAALPPTEVNAGISHDAAAASTGPVQSHQPTFEIKNISKPEVTPVASEASAPSSSFGYNLLSAEYEPVFQVKGLSSTFDLPLSKETSSTDVYNSDKMNFL